MNSSIYRQRNGGGLFLLWISLAKLSNLSSTGASENSHAAPQDPGQDHVEVCPESLPPTCPSPSTGHPFSPGCQALLWESPVNALPLRTPCLVPFLNLSSCHDPLPGRSFQMCPLSGAFLHGAFPWIAPRRVSPILRSLRKRMEVGPEV